MTGDDQDLRDRFTALRIEEEMRVPEFLDVLQRRQVRGHSMSARRLIAGSALLAATIAAVVWFLPPFHRLHRHSGRPVASITEWKSPTDFLLDTPGRELYQTVPSVGVGHEYEFVPVAKQKNRHVTTQRLP